MTLEYLHRGVASLKPLRSLSPGLTKIWFEMTAEREIVLYTSTNVCRGERHAILVEVTLEKVYYSKLKFTIVNGAVIVTGIFHF